MDRPKVRIVEEPEMARAVSVQVTAFTADPVMRWLWPEPHDYVSHYPAFVRGFGGRAFEHGTAHVTEDFRGGSLWLPPGVGADDDALEAVINETVAEPARSEVLAVLEKLADDHPREPHWHLAFIGADPASRGQGLGAALLSHVLEKIDADGVHCYLESSNPRNLSLYQRHGFELVREIRVGGSPPAFPMVRVPR